MVKVTGDIGSCKSNYHTINIWLLPLDTPNTRTKYNQLKNRNHFSKKIILSVDINP